MSDTRALVLEMLAESGIDGDGSEELVSCLAELDVYVDDTPPEPSPELAALVASLTVDKVVPGPFGRKRTRLFIAGAAALGAVGAGGIAAAAANELPSGAQTIVAEFSERFLPFELPHPDGSRVPHTEPTESEPSTSTDDGPLQRRATDDDGAAATTPSTGTTTAPAAVPTTEPSALPSTTDTAAPSAGAETGSSSPSASPSTGEASPGEPSQESGTPQGGETTTAPEAGETSAADPSKPSEPAAEPSGSSSPTANTRTEVTDSPSTTPSPSATPSATSSPSGTSSPSTAVWSDAD